MKQEAKTPQGAQIVAKPSPIKVWYSSVDKACSECKCMLCRGADLIFFDGDKPLCLRCADLDHLILLPSGDAALTRRASKYSSKQAVVCRSNPQRNRTERKGTLVESSALDRAEKECCEDSDLRARRRASDAERRSSQNQEYITRFRDAILRDYPRCPQAEALEIATHTCEVHSGRVGRSAEGRKLEAAAVHSAVRARVRHHYTEYDELMARGYRREDARDMIRSALEEFLAGWG